MKASYLRAMEALYLLCVVIAGTCMVAMTLFIPAGVFFRYVLNASLSWSDELATILFGWAICLFIASAYLHDEHVRLDWLVQRTSPVWRARVAIVSEGLGGGYLLSLIVASFAAMPVIRQSHTDALQLPVALHFAAIPVAAILMLIHWIRRNAWGTESVAQVLKLAIAVALLAVVVAPLGQYVAVAPGTRTAILTITLFGAMLLGVPVALSLGTTAALYIALAGDLSIATGALQVFNGINVFVLVAIPLLILSGKLMYATGIAERLVDLAVALIGRIRGGLGASNVLASFLFGDISGSAVSDTAAIGSLMIPEMKRRGYKPKDLIALLSTGAAMADTVPPSIVLIVLGSVVGVSIAGLFNAGFVIAGVLLIALAVALPLALVVAAGVAASRWAARRGRERALDGLDAV